MEHFHPAVVVSLKNRALNLLHAVLGSSGVAATYVRATRRSGATILMYHSVADERDARWIDPRHRITPAIFEAHMKFLARRRHVISMTTLLRSLQQSHPLPARTTVITFDDGYLDNLTVAAPILARLGLPATLYLPTGYIEHAQVQWVDHLYSMFRARGRQQLRLPQPSRSFDLNIRSHRQRAYREASQLLMAASREQRKTLLDEIHAQLLPSEHPPTLTMSWDDVRKLCQQFPDWEIGAHTRDHLDYSNCSAAKIRVDLTACLDDFQRELNLEPVHFSFPYSRSNLRSREIVADLGLKSAVMSSRNHLIGVDADPMALPRIDPPRSLARLNFMTSGAPPRLVRQPRTARV